MMAVLKMKSRKQWIGSKELEFYKIKIIMLMNAVDIVVHEPPKIMKNKFRHKRRKYIFVHHQII